MAGADKIARVMFGAALRMHRRNAGMSLRDLGRAIHYDHSRLSRAENGEHLPGPDYVRSIDAVLGTGTLFIEMRELAEQAAKHQNDLPMGTVLPGEGDPQTATVQVRMPDGRVMRMSISRRQLGELLAANGFLAMLPTGMFNTDETDRFRRSVRRPREVDAQVANYFLRLLGEHYTADKMLGPADLLPVVHAQITMLDRLRRDAQPTVRKVLTPVQCQYAEFLGWLYQDAGDTAAAMDHSDRASELAQISGDPNMIAYMLIRKSNIVYRDGDAVAATDLAAAAQHHRDGVEPKILALACQQEARGWAITGDYDHCEPKLREAADYLAAAAADLRPAPGAPAYIHHYDADVLEDQAATCYRDVGRTEQAIAIFQRQLNQLPTGHDRDCGYRTAKLAVAYATAHQPGAAATLGLQALTLARQTGSARTENELQPLLGRLSTWSTQPDVATLINALRSL